MASDVTAAATGDASANDGFSSRVLVYFLTQVLTAALVIFNGFFLARLIGPSSKGAYYLLTFLPPTLMVIGQLGLPQAFTYFSARNQVDGLVLRSAVAAGAIALPMLVVTVAMLPVLQTTILLDQASVAIVLPLLSLPFLLLANFTTGIVVGRQSATRMAIVYASVSVSATVLLVVLVGVLGLGVWGALVGFLVNAIILASGFLIAAIQVVRSVPVAGSASYRGLLGYGLPFYPGTLTQFLANRVDVYLLAVLATAPAAALGYYSMAFALAELAFLFPQAVSTFFLPRVAGAAREESDRQVAFVSRVTLLLTGGVALALVPTAAIAIALVLPAFEASLLPLYILLPGVVAVSVSQVLSGYVAGLGRPGLTTFVSILAFIVNVGLNVFLIPALGIVGASIASLVSYTLSSAVYSLIVARLSGARPRDFWIPRISDVRFVTATGMQLIRRIWPWGDESPAR